MRHFRQTISKSLLPELQLIGVLATAGLVGKVLDISGGRRRWTKENERAIFMCTVIDGGAVGDETGVSWVGGGA